MKKTCECSNYYRVLGCELPFGQGVCSQVRVRRLWSGNGDSVPVACRCELTGNLLRVGGKGNLRPEKIPQLSRKENPPKPFESKSLRFRF